jgi:PQQ-dependent catabolism-associated beta-propeller protein
VYTFKVSMWASVVACMCLVASSGSTPLQAAPTRLVFVSNERSNDIAVIDPDKDDQIVKRIATAGRPRDMSFNQDHSRLFVACGDDDLIQVIDVAKLAVIDSIPTGPSPEMFEVSHDDKLIYVSNEENSTVQVIDVASKTIQFEIATGAEPEGIALSTDGKTLYATSEVADMVHVIDAEAGVVTDNVLVGTRPRRFIQPDDNEIWVSNELSGSVSIIDLMTLEIVQTVEFLPPGFRQDDVTPVGMTMTHDGKTAVVGLGRANHIAFVDIASREIEGYLLVGSRAWGVDLTADDKTLYVANGLSDDVSVIDMASRTNVRTFAVGRTPHSVLVDD